jgi:hypothetical protein
MDCVTDHEHQHGNGCDGGGDVTEWKKVAELRAVVEARDPASKVLYIIHLCMHPAVVSFHSSTPDSVIPSWYNDIVLH